MFINRSCLPVSLAMWGFLALRVSGSNETKTYGKNVTVREHEELPTRPRRSLFGKDGEERSRIFNGLPVLLSLVE
ncbi:MAG: hypothetical protein L0387_18585 [Acidobacteria bacterium]|nr:hypothetical protein [Acidobacteriota bacterium]